MRSLNRKNFAKRALEDPLRQIAHNAGYEGPIVAGRIRESEYENFGLNAETAEHGNLVKRGGVDPGRGEEGSRHRRPGAVCTEPKTIFAGQSSWGSDWVPTQSFSNDERHAPLAAEEGEMSNADHRNLVLEPELIRNRALRTGTGTSRRVTLSR